jgi:hypothetical protein
VGKETRYLFWAACFSVGCLFAQPAAPIHVTIKSAATDAFFLLVDEAPANDAAESSVTLLDLNPQVYQLIFKDKNGRTILKRPLQLTASGLHQYQLTKNRQGQFILRYRGTLDKLPTEGPRISIKNLRALVRVDTDSTSNLPIPTMPVLESPPYDPVLKASLLPLIKKLKNTETEFEKLAILKAFISENTYQVDDLKILTKQLKFEHTKLQFLILAFEQCADRAHYGTLEALLEFETSHEALRNHIAGFK